MFLVGILSWWYSDGLVGRVRITRNRLAATVDFFSLSLLLKTFFAPFKRISADSISGPFTVHFKSFVDRSVSRLVGTVTRTIIIAVSFICVLLQVLYGIILVVFWVLIPLMPIIGLALWTMGWVL